MQYNTRT